MELSAGGVVVRRGGDRWLYLLLRAYRNWDFPKGTVEPGEDPLETAGREVAEETRIRDLRFRWGNAFQETGPYRGGKGGKKIARYYLAETAARDPKLPVSPELGRPEHHEYRWVGYRELDRLAPERLAPVVRWARRMVES